MHVSINQLYNIKMWRLQMLA